MDDDAGPVPMASAVDFAATIDTWLAQGAQRLDPVRFHFIEALARRAAGHQGNARRILEDRLAQLVAAYSRDLDTAGGSAAKAPPSTPVSADGAGPGMPPRLPGLSVRPAPRAITAMDGDHPVRPTLAGLVDHLARLAPSPDSGASIRPATTPARSSAPELKSIRYFKRTLSKLSAEQRLAQSRAKLPENAGPLHSHHLVHRALTLMHDLSPDYLHRFIGHVDTLLWLDRVSQGQPLSARETDKKATRGRAG
jgi:hypothetical protein